MASQGYVQVTRKCNQRCRFCSNPEREETVCMADVELAVEEFVARGYEMVIFSGGEPTLHEGLADFVAHAAGRGLHVKIITNASRIGDWGYLETLTAAGAKSFTVSLYSSRADVHDFLTGADGSFANVAAALGNLTRAGADITVATVINAYNAEHLDETAEWVVREFSAVRHFVWNNIDAHMNRAAENPDTIPELGRFELSLWRACRGLEAAGRSFRVERVPLCYMADFAHCSTETRKIVKGEERLTFFLDEKGRKLQDGFRYVKAECCGACSLDGICAGLYMGGECFDTGELHAVFVSADEIRERILGR